MTSDIRFDEREIEEFNSVEIKKKDIQKICESDLATNSLTIKELSSPRSYDEFIEWYERKIELFSESEEIRKIARLCGSPYKEFYEEVMPFRALVDEIMKGTDATVRFPCSNTNKDVILHNLDGEGSTQFIEIVSSGLNKEERLRMEMLSYKGHVSGFGKIDKHNTTQKGEYRIVANPEMKLRVDIENGSISNVIKRIVAKNNKKYNPCTWLLVSMQYGALVREESLRRVVSEVKKRAPSTQFSRIYLVTEAHSCARIQ